MDLPEPGRQRRWTVLLRWLLLIPQYIALLFLWVAASVVLVVGWFAALITGRLPEPIASFLTGYLVYSTRVTAYAMLLVDAYPPFAFLAPDYPVQVEVHPGKLNRLAVLFRIILLIPATVVVELLIFGWYVLSPIFWLMVLIRGRMPRTLFEATAATARYDMRLYAYLMMLTAAYPKRLFGDAPAPSEQPGSATRPLLLSDAGKALVVCFLVLGAALLIFNNFISATNNTSTTSQPSAASQASPSEGVMTRLGVRQPVRQQQRTTTAVGPPRLPL
ncbi:hypothetical protein GCM10010121_022420 [Streptomyces brasiliensis]|uniref:DUF4389 domain-containing protein n=1 Tax=Streptomyces brasiliensis TaxID=1954 RepID=A0A917NMM3_9ACTN|nr:hypothetical protein GCM10010121_022420 [Streptomyces brasiliensis]